MRIGGLATAVGIDPETVCSCGAIEHARAVTQANQQQIPRFPSLRGGTPVPVPIDRDQLQRLIDDDAAQVVEVLPKAEYDWAHLAGATHLWLRDMDRGTVNARLDPSVPVIAYCNDFQ